MLSRGPRILIVEDDAGYAEQLVRALAAPEHSKEQFAFDHVSQTASADLRKYLEEDLVDIYIVDLKLDDPNRPGRANKLVGINLVKAIADNTNAGVIVHSSEPAEVEAWPLVLLGADEYIQKPESAKIIRSKILALWRRIQMIRPSSALRFAHTNRAFRVGDWLFVVGSREMKGKDQQLIRLTPTEHFLLRYLCLIETHEIDLETFNVSVLERPASEKDKRMDGLIHKLRKKLGPSVELLSKREGIYRLATVQETKMPSE